ncbi:MAG: hypothetical protein RBR42_08865 [Desulfomicrobium sp.]|nr:hypothetical protein [Desulfomicrobium sp.]NLV98087.1 hypothetical protein [Desulfovibrionales bacterium]
MTTIMPTDKNLRHAIAWIEEHRSPDHSLRLLMHQAATKYNLTPNEELALERFYQDEAKSK